MTELTMVEALEAIGMVPEIRWVCQVVRSGYHNGAGCSSNDPHAGWGLLLACRPVHPADAR